MPAWMDGLQTTTAGHSGRGDGVAMLVRWFQLTAAVTILAGGGALAQQPVRPLPRVGGCPVGYYTSGSYCVPSKSGNTRGAIEKAGNSCLRCPQEGSNGHGIGATAANALHQQRPQRQGQALPEHLSRVIDTPADRLTVMSRRRGFSRKDTTTWTAMAMGRHASHCGTDDHKNNKSTEAYIGQLNVSA